MEPVPGHICPWPTLVQEHLHPDQPLIGSNLYLSSPLSLARVSQGKSSAHSHFTDEATEACREVRAHQRSLSNRGGSVRIGMADVSRSGFATSHPAPFSPGLPFQPTPPAPTSSQFILSRILPRLPLASNLAHLPKLLDFKGRTMEILIVSMTARKCPFYLSSCNLGALGDHPWLPDDHPYGNPVSFVAPFPSTPFTRQLCALLLGCSIGLMAMRKRLLDAEAKCQGITGPWSAWPF